MPKNLDPMKLLYPSPKTDAFIDEMEVKGHPNVHLCLARALGMLAGDMLFHGKTDDEILARMKIVFAE